MLTKKKVLSDYTIIKNLALRYYKNNKIEESLICIETACKIANHINFILSDYEIEDLLGKISEDLLDIPESKNNVERFIFYDCFAYDNRGLTQQYIRALMSWDVHFLVILEDDKTLNMAQSILSELNAYSKAEIFIPSPKLSRVEKIKVLSEKIKEYSPSKAFFHLTPWDAVGITLWNAFKSTTRYQINLTDHAFWIGINCSDYIIEFRDYGYNLSADYRKIDKSKLLIVPYYPIISNKKFLGFPDEDTNKNKVKLFSGGNFYKVYGENGIFFDMMQRVLEENPNTVLYFAGSGVKKPFDQFIKKNKLEKRVYLLGDRADISEVFKNIDIYIGTYPLCGGLMSQFAGVFKKPIVAYSDVKYRCNFIESLFPNLNNDVILTYTSQEEYYKEINKLVQDVEYRKTKGGLLGKAGIAPPDFNELLRKTIETNTNKFNVPFFDINLDAFCDLYIDNENYFTHSYHKSFNLKMLKMLLIENITLFFRVSIYLLRYSNKSRFLINNIRRKIKIFKK